MAFACTGFNRVSYAFIDTPGGVLNLFDGCGKSPQFALPNRLGVSRGTREQSLSFLWIIGDWESGCDPKMRHSNGRRIQCMPTKPRQFWIGVISREHVDLGVEGGFIQLNHGKKAPLQLLRDGDGVAMYSPRTAYPGGELLQSFTAIGVVCSGEVYRVQMAKDFEPYRVDVSFFNAKEAPIKPLIAALSFIKNKTRWGAAFRFGYLRVPAEDFMLIAEAMGVESKFS